MLACDAGHPFSGTKVAFPSRYRTDSFMSKARDLSSYETMFTEGEPKDMSVKCNSPPATQTRNAASPNQPSTEIAQIPPQITHQRHSTSPPSSVHEDLEKSLSPPPPPCRSLVHPVVMSAEDKTMSADAHRMMHLLQQRQQQQQHELDVLRAQRRQSPHRRQSPQRRQSPPQQYQQQRQQQCSQQHSPQPSKDLEMNLGEDKGNYSDSDSSSPLGLMESDMAYNRRFQDLVTDSMKDSSYWEKRRRNNEAARRSREKRRFQDMALEGRITCLESDNGRLRRELLNLKKRFNLPEDRNIEEMEQDARPKESCPPSNMRMSPPPLSLATQPLHSSSVHATNSVPSINFSQSKTVQSYTSPPPLLNVAGAIQMGMAIYPSPGPALPYFFSEASRMNHEARGGGIAPGIPSLPTGHHVPVGPLRRHSLYPPLESLKQEKLSNEEVHMIRERSNSNVLECRPSYQMDMPEVPVVRRGSVGNYVQCGRSGSPPSATHQAYTSSMSGRTNPGHFLSRPYDSLYSAQYNQWSQRSPASSQSSDDNYDEPLQLTVRRDSSLSTHSSHSNSGMHDNNSRESDQGGHISEGKHLTPGSPPASSYPLKLRHKLPPHEVYNKDVFPNLSPAPASDGTTSQQSFPAHPFMNGLAHLSDMTVAQHSPLSLIKKETFRQRRDSTNRAMARRNPMDHKYLDPKYLERRRRNNEAARKCRENRKTLTRIREVKSDYLENENSKLRDELNGLQEEMKQLRELIEKKRLEKGIPDDVDQKPLSACNDGMKLESQMYANQ